MMLSAIHLSAHIHRRQGPCRQEDQDMTPVSGRIHIHKGTISLDTLVTVPFITFLTLINGLGTLAFSLTACI